MRRIISIFGVVFLAVNLSLEANAGIKKNDYKSSGFNDRKQQEHYARMTKKEGLKSFSGQAFSSSQLSCTRPEHYAVAAILGVAICVQLVRAEQYQTASKSNLASRKMLPSPFSVTKRSVENGAIIASTGTTCSGDECHQRLSNNVVSPTDLVRSFVHPGLFNAPLIASKRDLMNECYSRNLMRNVNGQAQCFPDQSMLKTWEFDQSYLETKVDDRKNSDAAWDRIIEDYYPRASRTTNASPAERFLGESGREFQNNMKKLNGLFKTGEEIPQVLRESGNVMYINLGNEFPGMNNIDEWERYISENNPDLIGSYNDIVKIADNLPEHFRSHKKTSRYVNVAMEYVSAPFSDRMRLALEYVSFSNSFERFELLTKFFAHAKGHSQEDYDRMFNNLRSRTLKLFKKNPVKAAAYFHFRYTKIHPHEDANGRTARAIMNLILMSSGIDSVVFPSNREYQEAVASSAAQDSSTVFEKFLTQTIYSQQENRVLFARLAEYLQGCTSDCQKWLDNNL